MRVDFYEMSGNRHADPLAVACTLIGKAWPEAASRVAVVGRAEQLGELDRRLWEQPPGRFVPHQLGTGPAPIGLFEAPPQQADVLLNLDPAAGLPDGNYDRVLEIVPLDGQARQRLRERWRQWQQRGAELHHHKLK